MGFHKLARQHLYIHKMPVKDNLSSVWVRLSKFSQLSFIQYVGGGGGGSVYPFPLWWLRECIYFVLDHHQIGSMNYYPLFSVRSWNNGMRCMYFYIPPQMSTHLRICLLWYRSPFCTLYIRLVVLQHDTSSSYHPLWYRSLRDNTNFMYQTCINLINKC